MSDASLKRIADALERIAETHGKALALQERQEQRYLERLAEVKKDEAVGRELNERAVSACESAAKAAQGAGERLPAKAPT